jgi:polysaccharide deacetylase 2 family uncharacterized protein YibQ
VAVLFALLIGLTATVLWLELTRPPPVQRPTVRLGVEIPPPPAIPPGSRAAGSADAALAVAPAAGLVETGHDGPLPVIAKDGRKAWQVYARPFPGTERRPRVAIVITELGQETEPTKNAIDRLPGAVTLAFSPYAPRLGDWLQQARHRGHEVLVDLPMEPKDYPQENPGNRALLTTASGGENLARLEWVMSRGVGYVGLAAMMGSRYLATPASLKPTFEAIKSRGLLFVGNGSNPQGPARSLASEIGLPFTTADRVIDAEATRAGIEHSLAELEKLARRKGAALAFGHGFPATLDRVAKWAGTLDQKGLVLAPVSAIVTSVQRPESKT